MLLKIVGLLPYFVGLLQYRHLTALEVSRRRSDFRGYDNSFQVVYLRCIKKGNIPKSFGLLSFSYLIGREDLKWDRLVGDYASSSAFSSPLLPLYAHLNQAKYPEKAKKCYL
jgi:hypothetical protein